VEPLETRPTSVAAMIPTQPSGPLPSTRDADIRRILAVTRSLVGLDVAWVSRFDEHEQVFTHVDARLPGTGPIPGSAGDLAGSYCVRVLDGTLPAVVSDTAADPVARDLPVTEALGIGAYVGAPLVTSAGEVRGMLCATHASAVPALGERQQRMLEVLAGIIAALLEQDDDVDAERRARVLAAVSGGGRRHVLQPIVDVTTGRAVGAEALARFDEAPYRPDLWFAEADACGLLVPLEVAAAETALRGLAERDGYLSINLSPSTVTSGLLDSMLHGHDRSRVVVELTEHAQVDDYAALDAALAPHRAAGLRIAIDDAGAGYASFRHILQLHPDFIKVDLSLVRDIHLDPVRQALTASLLTLARTAGAQLIAEGVETQPELDTLARLGVTLMQGYLLGRPTDAPPLDGYPGPSRHVLVDDTTELSVVLANAVRSNADLEQLARPLLDAVLRLTGLETSFMTVLADDKELECRFVRNMGSVELPEGVSMPWDESLCSAMQARQLVWTNDACADLDGQPLAVAFGLSTYLTTPLLGPDGTLLGTLCAGSTEAVYITDATVAQIQLIAHVLSTELSKAR
jgi:EAL domain-containing protein (putative c-di-GMP-specific phosphodiesterase class I)